MCLILLAYQPRAQFPLVVAANRDEFFQRPTQSAHFWTDAPDIYAGRDLLAGGTWMGIHRSGRFAAVTNFREPQQHAGNTRSRGFLCTDFLRSGAGIADYIQQLSAQGNRYAGFNLLLGDFTDRENPQLAFCSNRSDETVLHLDAGIHGISNGRLNEPWPKVVSGKRALAENLQRDPQAMLDILLDSSTAPPQQLPDTGIEKALEEQLSSRFIRMDDYGTRSATILRIDRRGNVEWLEQVFGPQAALEGRQVTRFRLDGAS